MSLITEEEAISLLKPHLGAIWAIVKGGWEDYLSLYSDIVRDAHCSTTRANIIHDHHIFRVSRYAQAANDVRIFDLSKLKVLVIDGQFAIRFKKFDVDLHSANLPTLQVAEFRGQEQLADLPPTYNLEAGYMLNTLETEIKGIYLVCPNRKENYWASELSEDVATQKIFDLFENQQTPLNTTEEVETSIRRKKDSNVIPLGRESNES